jgi:hypothetical protein
MDSHIMAEARDDLRRQAAGRPSDDPRERSNVSDRHPENSRRCDPNATRARITESNASERPKAEEAELSVLPEVEADLRGGGCL